MDHPELPLEERPVELEAPRAPERRIFGVGDLLRGLRTLLEDSVGRVWVAGETSNLFAARTGHYYFTLKDADGQIRCALFRNDARRLPFELEDGLELLLLAEPSIYEPRGELQLIVREVEPRGEGALQLAFEQLRRRLEAEGLFDDARKRDLPEHPRRIGIVTSPGGAAIRDVIQVSGRRSPATPLVIAPTRVQGEGAELEIAAALRELVRTQDVDLVLIVRGGGSLEDLWSFNTEAVVRAIAECPIPVITGVGHETDFTLADFVADQRAPTPSAAAMLALPDRHALRDRLANGWARLAAAAEDSHADRADRLGRAREKLRVLAPSSRLRAQHDRMRAALRALLRAAEADGLARRTRYARAAQRLATERPRTEAARLRLRTAAGVLARAAAHATDGPRARLATLAAQLDSLSPLAVLGRGYAVARRADDNRIIRVAGDVVVGDGISLRVARARIEAVVEQVEPIEPIGPLVEADD